MKAILIAVLTMMGASAFAGDAGCGLGSVIIQKNSKGLQLLAMTTNGSFLTQAFGITSGTSNCSSNGIVQNERQIEYFVEINHDDLSREMAQGKGEKLNTLAVLHGCQTSEAQSAFADMTQTSFEKIVPSAETKADAMIQNLKSEMAQNQKVTGLCQVASL
ncbi:MAG: DUF3015 family protein [Pseudobdellovibrionaceae bacterium]